MEGTLIGDIARKIFNLNHIGLYGIDMVLRLDDGRFNVTTHQIVKDDNGVRKVQGLLIANTGRLYDTGQNNLTEYNFTNKLIEGNLLKEVDEQWQNWLDYKAGKISRPCF